MNLTLMEKLYSIIIFVAVAIGIALGHVDFFHTNGQALIVPLLVAMLYITFLQIPFKEVLNSFHNRRFTYTSLAINFLWAPILAWALAHTFLGDQPALYLGFILLMVTPCTDWYLIFTGIAKGNVPLSTAILPINLILQLILLPVYLLLFGGTTGVVHPSFLLESILIVLVVPLMLSALTKILFRTNAQWDKLLSKFSILPIVFLSLAIMLMFASQGQLLVANLELLWKILVPIVVFFLVNYFVAQLVGKQMKFTYGDRASLSLTTLARNSPIALAIAMTAFPEEPLIALTLVIGPLLELPILALITQLLLMQRK